MYDANERTNFFCLAELGCIWVCNAEGGHGGGRLSGDLDNLTYLDVGLDRSWGRKGPVHWRGS